jgi:hypothetical protein
VSARAAALLFSKLRCRFGPLCCTSRCLSFPTDALLRRDTPGDDDVVLSVYAKGLTTGAISAHFAEISGASVSKERVRAPRLRCSRSWARRRRAVDAEPFPGDIERARLHAGHGDPRRRSGSAGAPGAA